MACQRIKTVNAIETRLGNPDPTGGLHMAVSYIIRLDNGGTASVIANYLNPKGFGQWGNEHLRIFGTKGFVEVVDGGARTRLIVGDEDRGPLKLVGSSKDYLNYYLDELTGRGSMPLSLDDELRPTRIVIRAKESAG